MYSLSVIIILLLFIVDCLTYLLLRLPANELLNIISGLYSFPNLSGALVSGSTTVSENYYVYLPFFVYQSRDFSEVCKRWHYKVVLPVYVP